MSQIVFGRDLRKSVALVSAKPPLYARPKVWLALLVLNIMLAVAATMSWKFDAVWGILPPAKAYTANVENATKPVQSSSGRIIGWIRPVAEEVPDVPVPEPTPVAAKPEPLDPRAQKAALFIASNYRIAREASELIAREAFKAGKENSVDPLLMLAIIGVESRFNPIAESHAGALGLTQAMPESHPEKVAGVRRDQGGHILNIADNIQIGAKIIGEYMRKFDGNAVLALQQYNGSLKDTTRVYSKKVLELRAKFTQAGAL